MVNVTDKSKHLIFIEYQFLYTYLLYDYINTHNLQTFKDKYLYLNTCNEN